VRIRLLGPVVGAGLALALIGTTPAAANPAHAHTLRAEAAKINLRIGTAVDPYDLNTPAYRRIVATQFSTVTPENEMKWQVVEPTRGHYDWSGADRLVRFASRHHQLVRGHVLLWHNQLPGWLVDGVNDGSISNAELRTLLHKHITDEVSHFKGRIWQWDVANEFFTDSTPSHLNQDDFWISHLGAGIIAKAFRWAHAADRKALLFYNDYNIASEDGTNAKSDAVYAWVQKLLARGVPIDGIGDQGHLDLQYGAPARMTQDLRRYAKLGLKVAVTEADVRTFVTDAQSQTPTDPDAPQKQADYYGDMLRACLEVKQCISFTVWEFGDSQSWVPATFQGEGYAGIYDVNLAKKPSYHRISQDLRLAAGAPRRPHT
jgi:endo-1,4-beta-xylanase